MIKKLTFTLLALLALVLPSVADESELTGTLKKAVKTFSPYVLELDGVTGTIHLRGEVLKDVPEGTRIHVSGAIRTELVGIAGGTSLSSFPAQWHMFMDVTKCTPIKKPFERPTDSKPQNRVAGTEPVGRREFCWKEEMVRSLTVSQLPSPSALLRLSRSRNSCRPD